MNKVDVSNIPVLELNINERLRFIGGLSGKTVTFEGGAVPEVYLSILREKSSLDQPIHSSNKEVVLKTSVDGFIEDLDVLVNKTLGKYLKSLDLDGSKDQTQRLQKLQSSLLSTKRAVEHLGKTLHEPEKQRLNKITKVIDAQLEMFQKKIDLQFYDENLFFEFTKDAKNNTVFTCRSGNHQGRVIAKLDRKGFEIDQTHEKELTQIFHNIFSHGITLDRLIASGNTQVLKMALTKCSFDLNVPNSRGETPLIIAARYHNLEAMKILIKHGADINGQNRQGDTPLIIACLTGNLEIVNFLIQSRANLNQSNQKQHCPLSVAISNSHTQIAKLLINSGADIHVENYKGWTPLFFAAEKNNKEIVDILISLGAKVNYISKDGSIPSVLSTNSYIKFRLQDVENNLSEMLLADFTQAFRFGVEVEGMYHQETFALEGFPDGGVSYLVKNIADSFDFFIKNHSFRISISNDLPGVLYTASHLDRDLYQEYSSGNPVMFLSGWEGHSICHLFFNGYYIQANRGECDLTEPGFYIYKIGKRPSEMVFNALQASSEINFYTKELHEILQLEECSHIEQPQQAYNNCTFVSFKSGVYALILLSLLQEKKQLDLLDEIRHEKEDNGQKHIKFNAFVQEAHSIYKSWAKADREDIHSLIDSYSVRPVGSLPPNLTLLVFILSRYKGNVKTIERIINYLNSEEVNWNATDVHGVSFIERVLAEENYLLIRLLDEQGILNRIDTSELDEEELLTIQENIKSSISYKSNKKKIKTI